MNIETMQWISLILFCLALIHTFSTKMFEHLAHHHPRHAGIYHLLGEVEVVFGFWAMVLIVIMMVMGGKAVAVDYLDSRSYVEPMFVFAIMVIAGSHPVLRVAMAFTEWVANRLPLNYSVSFYFVVLSVVPLLGSLITEPAAMTLAALILRDRFYAHNISSALKYNTLGVLFVNISVGGTLTSFAAPPVLMIANTWNWDSMYMLTHIGWKAVIVVFVNAIIITWYYRRQIATIKPIDNKPVEKMPASIIVVHLLFLFGVVVFAHHPPVFMGLLLFFLGIVTAYKRYQTPLILREGLLVSFFLAGLVVLGGQQQWWLEYLLKEMSPQTVFYGATALTAITDNAALTYLGSLVQGLSPEFKYALVTGAVTGGGLTVIANAPNPAGFSILRNKFYENAINPLGLLRAAILPTITAMIAFQVL